MHNFFLLILSICFFCGSAHQTTLLGSIKGIEGGKYTNSPVEVFIVNDFITYNQERIKQSETDANGNFKLTFNNSNTNIAILKLGKVERTFKSSQDKMTTKLTLYTDSDGAVIEKS